MPYVRTEFKTGDKVKLRNKTIANKGAGYFEAGDIVEVANCSYNSYYSAKNLLVTDSCGNYASVYNSDVERVNVPDIEQSKSKISIEVYNQFYEILKADLENAKNMIASLKDENGEKDISEFADFQRIEIFKQYSRHFVELHKLLSNIAVLIEDL